MPKRTDIPMKCAVIMVLALAMSRSGQACSAQINDVPVRPTFKVKVENASKPITGLAIELTSKPKSEDEDSTVVRTIATGSDGIAEFNDVPEGRYYVAIRHAELPYSIAIRVTREGKDLQEQFDFEWPFEVFKVRTLVGRLRAPLRTGSVVMDLARPQFQLLTGTKLILEEPLTSRRIGEVTTDSKGEFEFKDLRPGLYLIHVDSNDRFRFPSGAFAVEVDPGAQEYVLNAKLKEICGGLNVLRTDD